MSAIAILRPLGFRSSIRLALDFLIQNLHGAISPFDKNGRDCQVAVTVTNCGERAGKDVVQIYVSLPYQAGGVEKAATQLVAFVKTDLLEPGASARYTATFDIWDCSSYDADGEQAYILDAGDYTVRVAHDVKKIVSVISLMHLGKNW